MRDPRTPKFAERTLPIALQSQLIVAECKREFETGDAERMRRAFYRVCDTFDAMAGVVANAILGLYERR